MALISAISPWDTLNWGLKLPTVKGLRVLPADQPCSFSLFPVAGQGERPSGALVSPTLGTTWAPNPPVRTCRAAGTPFPIPPAPTWLAPLSPSFPYPQPSLSGRSPPSARQAPRAAPGRDAQPCAQYQDCPRAAGAAADGREGREQRLQDAPLGCP